MRQRRTGQWEAVWEAVRRFDTEEEARAAAELPEPPPPRYERQTVSDVVARGLTQLADAGLSYNLIAHGLNAAEVKGARGGRWSPASVRGVVLRERARRDAADQLAREQEWAVDQSHGPSNGSGGK